MRERQLLDAALDVFSKKGFAKATTGEIARKAGVAEGTIYNYFPNKRELFVAVIKDFVITIQLLDLIGKIPEEELSVTFKNILINRLSLLDSESISRMPSMIGEIQRDPELKAMWLEEFLQPFLSQLGGMYHFMKASGKLRRLEPTIGVRIVGGLIIGFLMLRIMEGETSPLSKMPREKVAEDITEFILHGLIGSDTEDQSQQENTA